MNSIIFLAFLFGIPFIGLCALFCYFVINEIKNKIKKYYKYKLTSSNSNNNLQTVSL